jgi:hypothetical protein
VKAAILSFLGPVIDRTQQMIDDIDAIDPSDVSGGEDAQASILDAARTNIVGLRIALGRVQTLDSSDETQMMAALLRIQKDMQAAGFNVPLPLAHLGDKELNRAFRHESGCQAIM